MKKNLMKMFIVMMITVMVLGITGCGSGSDGQSGKSEKKMKTIGIVQIVDHPSLNQIRESIIDQLEKEGFVDGENITIDYKNAQNDQNNLMTICQNFVGKKVDLIIAIATPSAQAALRETTEIPIIFSAVTDPVEAGIVKSLDETSENITGTSDKVSAEMIMNLAMEITPDVKAIGALYNSGEANSTAVIKELKDYAKSNNLKLIESTVSNTSEVQQAVQYLSEKVDAVFSPIDNTIASAMPVVTKVLESKKIPFYVAADSMVIDGGLATYGIDYDVLGAQTGVMVSRVLNGERIKDMPIETMKDMKIYINKETAKKIDLTIPASVIEKAEDLSGKNE